MYPSSDSHQISVLLRISRDLDIVGDVSATVDNPSELLVWASVLPEPTIVAWRATDSGHRFVHVTAPHARNPIHGRVSAVLSGEQHRHFWAELLPDDLAPGQEQSLEPRDLSAAWNAMPVTAPDAEVAPRKPGSADRQ